MAAPPPSRAAVLVEGRSDAAALSVLLTAAGVTDSIQILDMGGITNFRRIFRTLTSGTTSTHSPQDIAVLCDAGEVEHVTWPPFQSGAYHSPDIAPPVFICNRDLEDELIRGLGADRARTVVITAGLEGPFETFTRQPQWAGHPLADQLRRFAGAGSGRKELLAAEWARALDPHTVPDPLHQVIAWTREWAGRW